MNLNYDICVIGGGIHGAGVAQAAAAAGYRVVLLEQRGIAAATSGQSSKLIHGGLRYLESCQFGLVRKSLLEREILVRIAPQLVSLIPFYLPVYRNTSRRSWQVRLGLLTYAFLGNLRKSACFRSLTRRQWDQLDGLETRGLQHVYRYWDAQTDDVALTRAVLHSALQLGAELYCPAQFCAANYAADHVEVAYNREGQQHTLTTGVLINTTGPWINDVMRQVTPSPEVPEIELVQGTHILLENAAPRGVYYLEAPQDQRVIFVMPWREQMLVGTTETPFTGDPATVAPLDSEVQYLQAVLAHYFPAKQGQVLEQYAGLRVLPVGSEAVFSRSRDALLHVPPAHPRLLGIYGGKLTAYRATSAEVVRRVAGLLPQRSAVADTANLILTPMPDTVASC